MADSALFSYLMDLKNESYSTGSSAIFSMISPFEAELVVLDSKDKMIKLYIEKSLICPTSKHVNFITKLLDSLSSSKTFSGSAVLEMPEKNPAPTKLQYFDEVESLRNSAALLSTFRVAYKLAIYFQK